MSLPLTPRGEHRAAFCCGPAVLFRQRSQRMTKSGVIGDWPTRPRTPSVPKYFRLTINLLFAADQTASASWLRDLMHAQYFRTFLGASSAAATLAAWRCSTGRPVIAPSIDLRETPASAGRSRNPNPSSPEEGQIVFPASCRSRSPDPAPTVHRQCLPAGTDQPRQRETPDFGDDIMIFRRLLHGPRFTLHMHQTAAQSLPTTASIAPGGYATDIVDHGRPCRTGGSHDCRFVGTTETGMPHVDFSSTATGAGAPRLRRRNSARTGGFGTDIENVGALFKLLSGMPDGPLDIPTRPSRKKSLASD